MALLEYIILSTGVVISITFAVILFFFIYKTNRRLDGIEQSIKNLSDISKYFPDFIQKGERVSKNISEELTFKQNVLMKLISEADKASEKLGIVEEKIKENKLDRETVNKVLILVNQGFTPAEIAPKLNLPLGEIELVIKLRKYISSPIKEKL